MTLLQIIVLSLIQGLTEFLPVSSSGHLAMLQALARADGPVAGHDLQAGLGQGLDVGFDAGR